MASPPRRRDGEHGDELVDGHQPTLVPTTAWVFSALGPVPDHVDQAGSLVRPSTSRAGRDGRARVGDRRTGRRRPRPAGPSGVRPPWPPAPSCPRPARPGGASLRHPAGRWFRSGPGRPGPRPPPRPGDRPPPPVPPPGPAAGPDPFGPRIDPAGLVAGRSGPEAASRRSTHRGRPVPPHREEGTNGRGGRPRGRCPVRGRRGPCRGTAG